MAQDSDSSKSFLPSAATQRARRASAVAADDAPRLPDSQVSVKASRRRFTAEYKQRIVEQADWCREPGEIGALLRREGLYSSHLRNWRVQREQGALAGLTPRQRGRKVRERSAESVRLEQLERDNERLRAKLEQAQLIVEVQKKVSRLLGVSMPSDEDNASNS